MEHIISAKAKQTSEARSPIQVIARAAEILRAFEHYDGRMSLGQLADATGLPRSTVQRIVSALAMEKLLDVDVAGRGVALGIALGRLANARRVDVRQALRPYLERIATEVSETVDLSVLQDDGVVFVDQILSSERLRVVSAVGSIFPVASTAPGKILLASLLPAERDQWVRTSKEARGLKSKGLLPRLLEEVEIAARDGFAYDADEHTNGISALAISVQLPEALVHSISIPVPTARFATKLPVLKAAMTSVAEDITKRLMDSTSGSHE